MSFSADIDNLLRIAQPKLFMRDFGNIFIIIGEGNICFQFVNHFTHGGNLALKILCLLFEIVMLKPEGNKYYGEKEDHSKDSDPHNCILMYRFQSSFPLFGSALNRIAPVS